MNNLLTSLMNWIKPQAAEGQYRQGPYYLPVTGGWLSAEAGRIWNWWQSGYDITGSTGSAIVEACVSAYSQTVAMCPGGHWSWTEEAGRKRVTSSALSRIVKVVNDYDSISDFMLNLVRALYLDGNAYALALRNNRNEINELHLMSSQGSWPMVAVTGDLFYTLSGNDVIERRLGRILVVPARDVLHVRLHTKPGKLLGETPLMAAAADVAAAGAMTAQQYAFYMNMARPSNLLSTDKQLTVEQAKQLRAAWEEQSKGLNVGGTPILSSGLRPYPLSANGRDSQLAEIMKMSDEHVALAYRIPLQILGLGGTPFASTEALMQSWIGTGLGFALNHIEEAFGKTFALAGQPDDYMEMDTDALLRSSFRERIEALVSGVHGGLVAPNEGRVKLELPKVEHGDLVRLQQQDVPLSYGVELEPNGPKVAPPTNNPPPAENPPPTDAPEKELINANIRQWFRDAHRNAA